MELKNLTPCPYCTNQGLVADAARLHGKDGVTVYPSTVRYACPNGHKFAVPLKKVLTT